MDAADCLSTQELHNLLREEKLAGATLLIFSNKQDLPGALTAAEIEKVGAVSYCLCQDYFGF